MFRTVLKRAVVEGGPGAGKTGVIRALKEQNLLDEFQVVPELATILFGGFHARLPQDPLLLRRFNKEFFDLQLKFETMGMIQARDAKKSGLIMDRGLLTRLAFPGCEHGEFLLGTGMTEDKARQSYDLIIFMEMPSREVYEACRSNNPERLESYDEAVASGMRSRKLYQHHQNFKVIPGGGTWEERVRQVSMHLSYLLR